MGSSTRPLRADARRNREALLAAAREAFLAGEVDIRVEEIAKRAGVAVGTLYRHFETREAVVEEVYRERVETLCAESPRLLSRLGPAKALREFLLLLVKHAAESRPMASVLESIMATDSPVFDTGRARMSEALDGLLAAGAKAGVLRNDVNGTTVLRAMGGICGMRSEGWETEASRIALLLYDGLRRTGA